MKKLIAPLLLCLCLSLSFAYSQGNGTLLVRVHYPDSSLCSLCGLALGTPLDWDALNGTATTWGPTPSGEMAHNIPNLWTKILSYPPSFFFQTIELTVLRYSSSVSVDNLCPQNQINVRNLGAPTFVFLNPGNTQQTVDIWPFFCTQAGQMKVINQVHSPQLNNSRDIFVGLPPSFVENPLPRPVNLLIVNDGQLLPWLLPIYSTLVATGNIVEVIAIGVPSNDQRVYELTYSPCKTCTDCPGGDPSACDCASNGFRSGGGNLYLDFIDKTVIPLVKSQFKIQSSAKTQGIMGASLGGSISCYAAYTRSNVYTKAFCASPSVGWNCDQFVGEIMPKYNPSTDLQIYIAYGQAEMGFIMDGSNSLYDALVANGFPENKRVWKVIKPGCYHEVNSWTTDMLNAMIALFAPSIQAQ